VGEDVCVLSGWRLATC